MLLHTKGIKLMTMFSNENLEPIESNHLEILQDDVGVLVFSSVSVHAITLHFNILAG